MPTTLHVSLTVRTLLQDPKEKLEGMFRNDKTGQLLTSQEATDYLTEILAEGQEYIPISPCDSFDPKKGCKGHEHY